MRERKKIAIGVPCYNEEVAIPEFMTAIENDDGTTRLRKSYDFVFIFVDDGSKDSTRSVMERLAKERKDFYFVSFDRNYGKEAGLVAIYDTAIRLDVDALIKMDVDLQDPISLIPMFVEQWEAGYGYVYGHMNGRAGQARAKKLFSSMYYKSYRIVSMNKGMRDGDRDFALMDRSVIPLYASVKGPHRFDRSISSHLKLNRKSISYDFVDRNDGTTRWPFKRLFMYSIDSMLQYGELWKFLTRVSCATCYLASLILLILSLMFGRMDLCIEGYVLLGVAAIASFLLLFLELKLEKILERKNRNFAMYEVGMTNVTKSD